MEQLPFKERLNGLKLFRPEVRRLTESSMLKFTKLQR